MISVDNLDKKSDNEIVELVLKDQENFLYIVKRYKTKLFSYIRRISNFSDEEVEDVLQNIFIKVYQNINDFDSDLKFSSWIYRITHNEVIDNFRKNKARPQTSSFEVDDDRIKILASEFNIEKEIDREKIREIIGEALSRLDLKFKDILVLKFFEEKDYNEISDIIKKPKGTVASRMNKAKEELKKVLEEKRETHLLPDRN